MTRPLSAFLSLEKVRFYNPDLELQFPRNIRNPLLKETMLKEFLEKVSETQRLEMRVTICWQSWQSQLKVTRRNKYQA